MLRLVLLVKFFLICNLYAQSNGWLNFTYKHQVNALVCKENYCWLGTDGGLVKLNRTDETFQVYTRAEGLLTNEISSIAIDKLGIIWVGTDSGIQSFDGTNWLSFTVSNSGLTDNHIRIITVDSTNTKWLATPAGVSAFNGQEWVHYDTTNSDHTIDSRVEDG